MNVMGKIKIIKPMRILLCEKTKELQKQIFVYDRYYNIDGKASERIADMIKEMIQNI